MPNLGNTTTPSSGFWFDTNTNREYWVTGAFTMPAGGGLVTDLNVYVGGDGASTSGQLLLFDGASGAILYQSGSLTLPSGSRSIGGQGWVHATVPSVFVASGATIKIGFWAAGHVVWTFEGSGGVTAKAAASPTSATGGGDEYGGSGFGALGAYVTYTPGSLYADNGSAFVGGVIIYADDGASWQQCEVYVDDGSAWQRVG